ncbi:MAG TPA: MFS transporter [Mycobacteriales bacterium]|nr:MFS transporter [Mycobacteriales bacterium]
MTGVRTRWRRGHYAWVVAGVTFVTLLGASGFRSTPGVLIVPLEDAFGWSRTSISLAVSVNLVLFGLAGPFAAAAMGRFGVRRVVLLALLLVAAGSGLTVFMTAPWQLVLLWGVVVGIGTGAMAAVLAATVATRWFVARRGLVVGALTAASATGQLVFLPLLAWLAVNHGWQWASVTVAAGALLVVPLVALLLRNSPADLGLLPYGAPPDTPVVAPAPPPNPVGTALRVLGEAARTRAFWLLAGSFAICGATTNGLIGTHLIPAAHDHGVAETSAAGLLALVGVFDVVGTIASGWLTDRVDPRRLLFWYYGLRGVALLMLPAVLGSASLGLFGFVVVYGLDWVATVPPTVALANEVFGRERGPVVFGWVFAAHLLGAAAAASLAGLIRTERGDYFVAFISAAALCAVAATITQVVRAPKRPAAVVPQPAVAS